MEEKPEENVVYYKLECSAWPASHRGWETGVPLRRWIGKPAPAVDAKGQKTGGTVVPSEREFQKALETWQHWAGPYMQMKLWNQGIKSKAAAAKKFASRVPFFGVSRNPGAPCVPPSVRRPERTQSEYERAQPGRTFARWAAFGGDVEGVRFLEDLRKWDQWTADVLRGEPAHLAPLPLEPRPDDHSVVEYKRDWRLGEDVADLPPCKGWVHTLKRLVAKPPKP